jgi:hypothetical protein
MRRIATPPNKALEKSPAFDKSCAMSKKQPNIANAKKPVEKLKSEAKQAKLSEALRANLRRRKEQTRERKDSDKG